MKLFETGAAVVQRCIYRERVWVAEGVRVVSDAPERTLLTRGPGCACRVPASSVERYSGRTPVRSHYEELTSGDWSLEPWEWQGTRTLLCLFPERYWAVHAYWPAEGDFLGWYVNFQLPFRRTRIGFDTRDLALDLLVGPDRQTRWKDEDDFAECQRLGIISAAEADAVNTARSEVLDAIRARSAPFDAAPEWPASRPVAALPAGWAEVKTAR